MAKQLSEYTDLKQYYAETGRQNLIDEYTNQGTLAQKEQEFASNRNAFAGGTSSPNMPTSAEQVTPFLNSYQSNIHVPTEQEIIDQVTPKQKMPDLYNSVDLYNEQKEILGITQEENQLNDINSLIEETEAIKRQRKQLEQGKPVAMGVISGRVTEVERQDNERLDVLLRQKNTLVSSLNSKYTAVNTIMTLTGQDYERAVASYDREFQQNMQIYQLQADARSEQRDEYRWQVDQARSNLQIYANAITSGNMTYSELSPEAKLQITKLEAQSGLATGTIASMQLAAKDRILSFSEDNTEAWVIGDDGNMKVIATGLTAKPSGGSADLTPSKEREYVSTALKIFNDIDTRYQTVGGKLVDTKDEDTDKISGKPDQSLSDAEANQALREIITAVGDEELGQQVFLKAWQTGGYQKWIQ